LWYTTVIIGVSFSARVDNKRIFSRKTGNIFLEKKITKELRNIIQYCIVAFSVFREVGKNRKLQRSFELEAPLLFSRRGCCKKRSLFAAGVVKSRVMEF